MCVSSALSSGKEVAVQAKKQRSRIAEIRLQAGGEVIVLPGT
jgi:hypothetical protein